MLEHHGLAGVRIRNDVQPITLSDVLVRVRVKAAGVCHSDLSAVTGGLGLMPSPVVIGHEAAGDVVEVGDQVSDLRPGNRVMISWVPQCGACVSCLRGQPELCTYSLDPAYRRPRFVVDGKPVQAGCGVFAEEVVVTRHNLVPLPDDVPYEVAALISCGVSTGVGAVLNTARLRSDDTAVVIGCGGAGMSIVQAARAPGARAIVAVDPVAYKRDLARKLGASTAIAPDMLTDQVAESTGGEGSGVAFEAVGNPSTIRAAYGATRRGGTVIVGVGSADADVPFSARELYASGRHLVGSVFGSTDIRRDFPRTIEMWRAGDLEVESLISDRIELGELARALTDLAAGSALRSVVVF